ncbi:MAG TPA: hypothetical protein VIM70_05310 [Clostridium sp.]|uniref:hypothetical protein n=1 Tax=Clostridium sp. TaxID=1506 RepID=UPI002F92ED14
MITSEAKDKLKKVEILEYIGYDERPNTYYLIKYNDKKAILHVDQDFPAGLRIFYTPFVYGIDNYVDNQGEEVQDNDEEYEDDEDIKIVFNIEDEEIDYDDYLKGLGAEKLTVENFNYYSKEQEMLDKDLGDYPLSGVEHEEVVKLLNLVKYNPNASLDYEED